MGEDPSSVSGHLVNPLAPTHLAAPGSGHTEPSTTRPRGSSRGQHVDRQADRLHLLGPSPTPLHTPPHREAAGKGQACREGVPGRPAESLKAGFLWIPSLAGLSGCQRWLWKTLDPRVVRPGSGLSLGLYPTQTLCPSPTCPTAPRPPLWAPACLWQEAVSGCAQVRQGNIEALHAPPLPTPSASEEEEATSGATLGPPEGSTGLPGKGNS